MRGLLLLFAYGKYKSVFEGRTSVFAFMLDIAFSKLPL